MFTWLFNTFLFSPLLNLLITIYNFLPYKDLGITIIILTILIRLLLYPLYRKSIKSQKALQDIQPKMQEIQEKYKDNPEKKALELMKLYKENKVNPLSSCLPLLIQLPILIAVYSVFRTGISTDTFVNLYSFVKQPGALDAMFLGVLDLTKPHIFLAVLAGIAQFAQTKMLMSKKQPKVEGSKDENTMSMVNKQMTYIMPIFTVIIGSKLPGALTLYWFTTTSLMVVQQYFIMKKDVPALPKHKNHDIVSEQ